MSGTENRHGGTEQPQSGTPKRRGGLSSLAIQRPVGTLTLTSVVLVLGIFFLRQLPLDLLPSIVYPQIRAGVTNRGVAPEVMEETIAKVLETSLATTEDLVKIETEVQEGRVGVNLLFSYGTDIDFALQDASKNLDRARGQIPEEADPPTIFKFDPSQISVFDAAFSSEERTLISLRDWVDYRLRPQLLLIEGVASVDIAGGLVREIQVVLDQERLRSYGLTVSQVIETIRAENQDVAAGRVASESREIIGKTTGRFRTVEDVRSVLLPLANGGRIPLSEIATVEDTHQEQRLWARLDGVPAVKIGVRKQPNANTVQVARAVEARIAELASSGFVPADIDYRTIQNQADFIENSVNGVQSSALLGAGLAMLVVFLFLGSLRKTFTVGLAIPIAILATFIGMGAADLTLNIMSLGGLALGVGLLIDNSIVMLENIFRHRDEENLDADEAAHVGSAEVQSAVVASTATNLAAVVPFLLISGLAALIFRELILTISFAIAASLLVALTVVPSVSAQLAKIRFSSGASEWAPLRAIDAGVQALRRLYTRVMYRVVGFRWLVLGGSVALLIGTFQLVGDQGNEFLPQVDDGNVSVSISLPPGSAAEETNRITAEVEAIVREMPWVETVFATAGGRFFGASTSESAGSGSLDVVLASSRVRDVSADEWVRTLQAKLSDPGFPGARIFVRPPRIRGLRTSSSGSAVALSIVGDDLGELRLIGDEVVAALDGVPGLSNLEPSAEEASPQLAIELDRERAAFLGLDVARVGQTLRTALDGTVATRFSQGAQEYDLRVMLPRERFTSPEDVGTVALFPGRTGDAPIYLRDVADVYEVLGPTTIIRENQNRVFRITGDVLDGVASVGEVTDEISARLASLPLPEGYGIVVGGEAEAIAENNRQLGIVVALAIFLVFVVMAVQYESLVNPLVILLAIPLSLIGVGVAVKVAAVPLSAPVLLGVILLAGIVVNNAILLVEYVEQGRAGGRAMLDAVVDAGSVRLRPILMTTLTTAFGMLPLALGLGEGSELMQPLAVAVVGGLSLSTLLTLFVVPCAYLILHAAVDKMQEFLVGRRADGSTSGEPAPSRAALMVLLAATTLGATACGGGAMAGPAGAPAPGSPEPGTATEGEAAPSTTTSRDDGLFTVIRSGEDWHFEIPDSLFGRDLLVVTRIAGVPPGFGGYAPAGVSVAEQMMRFERAGERVLLRKIATQEVAADSLPIALSVVRNNLPPVVAAFEIERTQGEGAGASVVIDVTEFFAGDTPAISGLSAALRRQYQVRRLDPERSFITRISSYPENVEVRHTQTFDAAAPPSDTDAGTITLDMSQSIVLLPAVPMRPRYADPRVGYFSITRVNYGLDVQKAGEESFIRRWRLEPKDSAAYFAGELVEPVEPITWYIDPATPERWRRWVKLGVEDWNRAFEAAGFRNAVRALDPPSPAEDPEWDPEDIRHSVVRWAASTTRNAQGPSTSDPRSGEILEADIVWYHNHMRSYRNWLMVQTGAAMPEARSLEIPDSVMGEAMRQVIAHEIGHALGLPHNMISSSAFPVDSLRSPDFARRNGVAPSIMDYARQNYIAQPGDGLEALDFLRRIGPYDDYSVNWGYRLINTPDPRDERRILNRWIVDRADDPRYRYLPQGGFGGVDPRAQTEDLGDDPVRAGRYGLQNLRRIVPRLAEWTATPGEDWRDLEELYGEALTQYGRYVNHVVTLVGGAYVDLKSTDQDGAVFTPVPRARQREAMRFLSSEVFAAPAWLNERAILEKIGPIGRRDGITQRQVQALNSLLSPARVARLGDFEVLQPEAAYPLAEFLDDLKVAIWPGLPEGRTIPAYRRALQRAHLERVLELMQDEVASGSGAAELMRSDVRALLRAQMITLLEETQQALILALDRVTRAHLEDVLVRVETILEAEGDR